MSSAKSVKPVKKVVRKRDAHPLAHRVPPEYMYTDYISRKFAGVDDIAILEYAREIKQNVLMSGPTGPGKTSCVLAYCAKHKIPVVRVMCNGGIDPSTMFSRVQVNEEGLYEVVPTDVTLILRHGGVLYFDEVNFAPAKIMSVCHSILDKERSFSVPELEPFHLHPKAQIVATYNPDYEGTRPLNEAFQNRFAIQLEFSYDKEVEKQLVTGLPVLLELADKLRTAHETGDLETPVGPNALLEFEQFAWDHSIEFAVLMFVSRFKPHERSAVRNTVEHYLDLIKEQFEVAKKFEEEGRS